MIEVFCDGGSRGNPGPSAWAFVVKEDGKIIKEANGFIGIETNNFAEYTALIKALSFVKEAYPGREFEVNLDSQLVVSQLSGLFKIKSSKIRELVFKVRELEASFKKVTYRHVYREKNKEADKLVNLALDRNLNGA